jgi:tRNA threonylcarbamoyladenosine biosynthesis protein TsaE
MTPAATLAVPTAADMRRLGERLATLLRPGDLVLLTGDLGAGKTTLAQGIGAGLGVRGEVTSPTFVISREHPSTCGGPTLVHVDAYRLAALAEVDDLDLDSALEASVTVVEWGTGLVEGLADSRLEVRLARTRGGDAGPASPSAASPSAADPSAADPWAADPWAAGERRTVEIAGHGPRWAGVDLSGALG